jgi:pSer/pThr/pTyr-binding forkhead associated (FHA) protein
MDVLMLCYSDLDGQHRIPLEREITSIGRSPNQDIVMSDLSVSRCHAVILREGSEYTVVDQQSTHGTFLNGARIQQGMLKPGDLLQLGSLNAPKIQFQKDGTPTHRHRSSVGDLLSSLSELRPAGETKPVSGESGASEL